MSEMNELQLQAQRHLGLFKPVAIRLQKTGNPLEQDPHPILDPVTGKVYEVKLGRWFIMPAYMMDVFDNTYKPLYEHDSEQDTIEHKEMTEVSLPYNSKEFNGLPQVYAKENNMKVLFQVQAGLITEKKKILGITEERTDRAPAANDGSLDSDGDTANQKILETVASA